MEINGANSFYVSSRIYTDTFVNAPYTVSQREKVDMRVLSKKATTNEYLLRTVEIAKKKRESLLKGRLFFFVARGDRQNG